MNPTVVISKQGEPFLDEGQQWMYRNNVVSMPDVENGSVVDIVTEDGRYMGTGFLSKESHITVRILSKNHEDISSGEFFADRIRKAYAYRKQVEPDNLTNCRVVFGEADGLAGLVVDRYNGILVTQISSYGIEKHKKTVYMALSDVMEEEGVVVDGIYERNDISIRSKEGLNEYKGPYKGKEFDVNTIINENGLLLHVNVRDGQKTGYFLDQKSNRYLVRQYAKDKIVMDCFSHTGGFALNAALGGAKQVYSVDVSKTALDQGYKNAKLNHLEDKIKFVQADVFDFLANAKPGKFDFIILDPPAFAKNRRSVDHAYQGYKTINRDAMKLLPDGGLLASCSCSRFMEPELFEQMLQDAAKEANVTLNLLSVTQQNPDHPIHETMKETHYLKFYIFRIERNK